MNEFDSPNFTEYVWDKKAEGKLLLFKILMILGYVLFAGVYFLVCYISRIIPLFALCPVFLLILVFFTYRYVSFDCYFEFRSGRFEIGTIRVTKRGRKKNEKLTMQVKDATAIYAFDSSSKIPEGVSKVYDFSETKRSDNRIIMVFGKDGKTACVIFEATARVAALLAAYNPAAKDIKGKRFHG